MSRKDTALLVTVEEGIGQSETEDLAHGILFSIDTTNPDKVIFFGPEESKKTVDVVEKQYLDEFGEEFDYYEFVYIEDVDDFKVYFEAFNEKIFELSDYKVVIDYTLGTKTMAMAAAFNSMFLQKKIYLVGTERQDGAVIRGTERIITQNLYPIYDGIMIRLLKGLFNTNQFNAGKAFIGGVTKANKDAYLKLFNAYYYFDNVDYKKANEYFDKKAFVKEWPELKKQLGFNAKALHFLCEGEEDIRPYYVLASLISNARRRAEETKYDDAIARLYRSLELIAQIRLKNEYGINTADVDLTILEQHGITRNFEADFKGVVRISLIQGYELLNDFGDEIGKLYIENKHSFLANIFTRNNSILAHGLNSQSEKEYNNIRDLVLKFAKVLNPNINRVIRETEFPEFEIMDF